MVVGKIRRFFHDIREGINDARTYRIKPSKQEAVLSYRFGTKLVETKRRIGKKLVKSIESPQEAETGENTFRRIIKAFFSIHLIAATLPVMIFIYAFDRPLYGTIQLFLFVSLVIGILSLIIKLKVKVGSNFLTILLIIFPLIFLVIIWMFGRNVPDYGALIKTYLPPEYLWIWNLAKWIIIAVMFFSFLLTMDIKTPIMFSIGEIVIFFILLPAVLGYFGIGFGGNKKLFMREWCKNKIVAMLKPEECRILEEGAKPPEVKYKPVEGKIVIELDRENLQEYIIKNTYSLPFSVINEFSAEIPVQVAGLLESGTEDYRFLVNSKECGIGTDSWCKIPGKGRRDFIVSFNPETVNIDHSESCTVSLRTSQLNACDCGRDETENIVGCGEGEECVYVRPNCCRCISWKKESENNKNFFYPGARVRFRGYFLETKSYDVVKSSPLTGMVHRILGKMTKTTVKQTGWRQDNLEIASLIFPKVYDFTLYKEEKPTLIFQVKNTKKGEVEIDTIKIEVAKKEFGPEMSIESCKNAEVEKESGPYTITYKLEPSVNILKKNEQLYVTCELSIPKEIVETPPYKATIYFNVFMNYTYTKTYVNDKFLVKILTV